MKPEQEISTLFDLFNELRESYIFTGITTTAIVLQSLQNEGSILPLCTYDRAAVIGCGAGHEVWLLHVLGVSEVVGIDNWSSGNPAWHRMGKAFLENPPSGTRIDEEEFGERLELLFIQSAALGRI